MNTAFLQCFAAVVVAIFGASLFVIPSQSGAGQGGFGAAGTKVLADHGWGP
ncbi:hypothetical protein [Streptomyces sp. NPDC003247]|uniref:hypothetical protein n=1 Tax=Streptomyces sp. NPDC003247 TaxID=3364677 RepID=UPI0036BB594F